MTRSTLLHLLAHPTVLTGADVRELEQLAQAFPYCQTAHLLLAKAAHDQGSMLAGQRLRRAATYATDRAHLRQLIEQAPVVEVEAEPALASIDALVPEAALAQGALIGAFAGAQHLPEAPEAAIAGPLPALVEVEQIVRPDTAAPAAELDLAHVLPASAPPIRPPAEAKAAHLEFGLADAEPTQLIAYQLPELVEPEQAPATLPDNQEPALPLPVFGGVAGVGYAPEEGSRLGFCLQSIGEEYSLTAGPAALVPSMMLPPAGEFFAPDALVLAHLANQQSTATAPPPAAARDLINSFLQRTPQANPRRRSLPPPDAEDEEQPDLSGRSTRVVPDLASENLAKILARQGKPERAIAIYERLMVKHPEKMAYFAAQIDSLRPQA